MSKFDELLNKSPIERVQEIPHNICETLIIDVNEYHKFVETDLEKKNEIDEKLFNFKKSRDYIGFYNKPENENCNTNYRIFIRSTWNSKKMCERKLTEFLKGGV